MNNSKRRHDGRCLPANENHDRSPRQAWQGPQAWPAENTQKEGGEEAMKTVQQIMQVGNAQANIQNFRYMQEHYTYDQKVRHAKNVRSALRSSAGRGS